MMRKSQDGFTLIELLVTIAVTGLIVAGITNLYIMISATQHRSYHTELATRAGEREIESLRNSLYSNLVPGSTLDFTADLPADLPEPNAGSVAVSEPTAGIRRVDVTITFKEGNTTKTIKQSSLIGVLGISQ